MSAVTARLRLAARSVSTARNMKTTSICASYVSHPHRRPYSSSTHPARSSALALKRKPEHTPAPATEEPQEPASSFAQGIPRATAGERDVFVHWDGAEFARFHHLWLRDHCRCPECFHPITKQRLLNTFDIPSDVEPAEVRPKAEGLEVVWHPASQPHTSFYPWSWLRHNAYDPQQRREAAEKVLWGSKIEKEPPTVAYEDVMALDGRGLFTWLSKIDKFGFCFVSGVPPTPEATEELSTKIGFIRETHYGKFWDFTADLARGDTAYTNLALPAHTDNTYFTDPCGIQLFHLLSHTGGSGGATLLADGFYVASIIQDLRPEVYKLLSDVPVPTHAAGEDGVLYRASAPVLGHDVGSGALRRVRWNNDDRSVVRDVPAKDMLRWYDAIKTWNKALTAPDSEYWVQLTPGTVIAIDNHRVLHGRSAFDGSRRMCGAYIGGDEFRSKLAVLTERFAASKLELDGEGKDGRSVWSGDF